VNEIPYFETFRRFQLAAGQQAQLLVHEDEIPYFDIIGTIHPLEYRHIFCRMPTTYLDDYLVLCQTLDYLAIDVVPKRRQNMRELFRDIVALSVHPLTAASRDLAFELLHMFLCGNFSSDLEDSNTTLQATLYIVSNRRLFNYPIRKMIRDAYDDRFVASTNQLKQLNRWPVVQSSIGWPLFLDRFNWETPFLDDGSIEAPLELCPCCDLGLED
jgi:hypothetical protein